jgi:two-component system, OmpR family, response regulator
MTFINVSALFASGEAFLPRFRHIGDLTLDLFHHDGRVDDQWLSLQPHEFELLWRLAKEPRKCVSEHALRLWARDPESMELATERLIAKLISFRLANLITRDSQGCYCLKGLREQDLGV